MTRTPEAKPKVLAVDDIPANLVAIEALLHRDYEVIRAHSGREALAHLAQDPNVDVILMDIQMPGMDGYETATRIKAMPECREIPLIFVTAVFAEDPHVKRGYQAGAVDYFAKPFDPDVLKMKVGVYASFRRRSVVLARRERQLAESEQVMLAAQKMEALLDSQTVGVAIADRDGRIFQTNDEVLRLLGSDAAVSGDAYGRIMDWWNEGGRILKTGGDLLAQAIRHGTSLHNHPVDVSCLDGTHRSLRASTSPLREKDGTLVGAVVVLIDVRARREAGQVLEKKIATLISLGAELQASLGP